MPKVNHELYETVKADYQRKFGKYKPNKKSPVTLNKEPMELLQEYNEVTDKVRVLIQRRKWLKKELKRYHTDIKIATSGYLGKPIYLYVLKLENSNWYVGISRNVEKRFKTHVKGKGANWTRLHKPVAIHEIRETNLTNDQEACLLEDQLTIEYALNYGHDKVRGGGYCQRKPRWPEYVLEGIERHI